MASLIPGFEYDIFISYRQKDNKHDGWVTEFVNNLKGELESTFKEEISVYFDINPHDGLLETHDVNASLKEKLKCLIFIPIISQTYCDSKSFAWQNEFVAFNQMAKEDQFGRDIRLVGGNVASRILPVKIHDLDSDDKMLLENELGGVLRSIEFIFKSAGVNRPLNPSDNPEKNLNKTYYRDQINKVANGVKEIITALKKNTQHDGEVPKKVVKSKAERPKNLKIKYIMGLFLMLALIVLGYFFIPKLFKPAETIEKSIAVLPFYNLSGDPNQEYMSDGLTDEIINHLYKIASFDKVVSFSTVRTFKGTDKKVPQIADELQVRYILAGTYKKIGDQVRVTVQLIDPKNDNHIWQNQYDQPYKEITTIQADIALQIADNLKAYLTSSEKQNIQKAPTKNQEAYDLIQQGLYLYNTRGLTVADQLLDLGLSAIKLDPDYADAYAFLGNMTFLNGSSAGRSEMQTVVWDAVSYWDKALALDQNSYRAHLGLGLFNEWVKWDYIKAEKEFLKANELSPKNPDCVVVYTEFLEKRNRPEDALSYLNNAEIPLNFQTRIQVISGVLSGDKRKVHKFINNFLNSKEESVQGYAGEYYLWMQEYDSAKLSLEIAFQNKDKYMLVPRYQAYLALAYYKTKNYRQAQMIINQLIDKSIKPSAGSPEYFTGWYYSGIGKVDSAFYWLEEAYKKRSPEMPWLKVDPVFKNLKDNKRYWDLYARTGHKAYDDYIESMKK